MKKLLFAFLSITTLSAFAQIKVDTNGNVGVGTDAPTEKLTIGKTLGGGYTSMLSLNELNNSGFNSMGIDWNFAGSAGFPWGSSGRIELARQNATNTFDMIFHTSLNGSLSERMRILGNGNVGIGTTNPGATLEIKQDVAPSLMFRNNNGTFWFRKLGNDLILREGSPLTGDRVTFQSGGNVGIGTTTPAYALDVVRANHNVARFESTGTNIGPDVLIVDIDNQNNRASFQVQGNGGAIESFYVGSNGNVGIGNTNPTYALDIVRANHNVARFESTGTNVGPDVLIIDKDNQNNRASFQVQGNGGAIESFYVGSNGNVGIGTNIPSAKLDVNGSIKSNTSLANTFYVENHEALRRNSGFLYLATGAGFTSGIYTNKTFRTTRNIEPYSDLIASLGTTTARWNEVYANKLDLNGDAVISNSVGIGTTDTFGHKLAVNGTIRAKETILTDASLNWPDYVFEKNYNLLPLEEIEKHIEEKGHLPNIPSAKEVAQKGGVSLGEMNKKLLEKIEELMLYTIQQEKRIKALEKELSKSKK